MCCTQLAANTGCKKVAKNRPLGTIAQLCRATSLQIRHVIDNRKKTCFFVCSLITVYYGLHCVITAFDGDIKVIPTFLYYNAKDTI